MATEQPTKEQWREIENRLRCQYSPVYLDCDGYILSLMLAQISAMKLGIKVYVDGWFKGTWLHPDEDGEEAEEARRFLPSVTVNLFPPKERQRIEKALGKREARKFGAYKSFQQRRIHWTSTTQLRRHLARHNDRIEWITYEEAEARRARKTESA
jgi:hypothetical protein